MDQLPEKIGPYRVVRLLGEGGMGVVFEAVHDAIERRVAIKILHPQFAHHDEVTARFWNEARAVNRIAHPGLVQASDYGKQPDGAAYIVMEYLDGEPLSARLKRCGGRLPVAEVIHLGWQLADSLAAAHGKGIVHRGQAGEDLATGGGWSGTAGDRFGTLAQGADEHFLCGLNRGSETCSHKVAPPGVSAPAPTGPDRLT